MLKRAWVWLLLGILLIGGQRVVAGQSVSQTLILVGGGDFATEAPEIVDEIIAYAGGVGTARIGVITAASIPESEDPYADDPDRANNSVANGIYYSDIFLAAGADVAEWIPIDLDNVANNSDPAVVAQIEGMTGFFFGGGDQSRLVETFFLPGRVDSPALSAIRQRFAEGAVVAGTSAGTAIQVSGAMVTGGESYYGIRYGAFTSSEYGDDLTYDLAGGFGFFDYGLLDTHFAERGRQGRIIRLAWDTVTTKAYGVDESTALIVTDVGTPADEMRVTGAGGVFIADLSGASRGNGSLWTVRNVSVSYLTEGDRYDPTTHTFVFANWKTSLTGRELYPNTLPPTNDIFSSPDNVCGGARCNPSEFVIISTDLFDSEDRRTYGLTYESGPTYQVRMVKNHSFGSEGFQGYLDGQNYYAYKNLKVHIVRN